MDKKILFGALSIISFASILFLPSDSGAWVWLVVLGVIFGIGWYRSK